MTRDCEHEPLKLPSEYFIEIFNDHEEKIASIHLCKNCHLLYWEEPDGE